jgi:hypothetical protein
MQVMMTVSKQSQDGTAVVLQIVFKTHKLSDYIFRAYKPFED